MSESVEKDASCPGCGRRPCVCETVVLPTADHDAAWYETPGDAVYPEPPAESDAPPIRAHHLNTCTTCRDWGHLERHEDHWPPSVTPPAEKGQADA